MSILMIIGLVILYVFIGSLIGHAEKYIALEKSGKQEWSEEGFQWVTTFAWAVLVPLAIIYYSGIGLISLGEWSLEKIRSTDINSGVMNILTAPWRFEKWLIGEIMNPRENTPKKQIQPEHFEVDQV